MFLSTITTIILLIGSKKESLTEEELRLRLVVDSINKENLKEGKYKALNIITLQIYDIIRK